MIAFKKVSAGAAAAAAVAIGFSTLVFGATSAQADTTQCGDGGLALSSSVCEITFTSGSHTFTPTANMSQVQVLLVAGGGAASQTQSDSYGGGGGEAKIVGFGDKPLAIIVGAAGEDSSATEAEQQTVTATAGFDAGPFDGGTSGNDNAGNSYSGGGAGGSANNTQAGDGYTPGDTANEESPFYSDTECYGGGGAGRYSSQTSELYTATCGGGSVTYDNELYTVQAPRVNSGGGGTSTDGGLDGARLGAAGVVVVRWFTTALRTATFDTSGHGTAVQSISAFDGDVITQPADPTAEGFTFNGWYTDAAFTTKADFTTAVSASFTLYASWTAVLATTGAPSNPLAIPLGSGALLAGLALMFAARRTNRAHQQ